jgi:hypothetical protein
VEIEAKGLCGLRGLFFYSRFAGQNKAVVISLSILEFRDFCLFLQEQLELPANLARALFNGGRDFRRQARTYGVERDAFNSDEEDFSGHGLGGKDLSQVDRFPQAEPVSGNDLPLRLRQLAPVKDVDGTGFGAKLHGVDHNEDAFSGQDFQQGYAPDSEQVEPDPVRQRFSRQRFVNGTACGVIPDKAVSDADNQCFLTGHKNLLLRFRLPGSRIDG